eukprot:6181640-Pleurochrysis_carterae.AAC.1
MAAGARQRKRPSKAQAVRNVACYGQAQQAPRQNINARSISHRALALAVFLLSAMRESAAVDFASSIKNAVLDPYRTDLFWWLENCPATKCYDGGIGATALDTCGGSNMTNLCHTAYADQIHTLTYEFTESFYVEEVTIWNKPGYMERLK